MDLFVVVAVVAAAGGPVEPVFLRVDERGLGIDLVGKRLVGGEPREHERDALAGPQNELGHRGHLLAMDLERGAEAQRIGPRDRHTRVADTTHPRHDGAVVEADSELGPHRDVAVEALDDPDDVRRHAARRHEVDRAHAALVGLVDRLENQRVVAISAR